MMRQSLSHDEDYLRHAIELAEGAGRLGDPPFAAVIVKDHKIIAEALNNVVSSVDPTGHAEIVAIRAASKHLRTLDLRDCKLYASCEPCIMCRGALQWAHISSVFFSATREIAESYGFSDGYPYARQFLNSENYFRMLDLYAEGPFIEWSKNETPVKY